MILRSADTSLIEACSIEVWSQCTLLFFIILPLCTIVYPAVLISFASWALSQVIINFFPSLNWLGEYVEGNFWFIAFGLIVLISVLICYQFIRLRISPTSDRGRRLKELRGASGAEISSVISNIWLGLPGTRGSSPRILWFSNVNVMASAFQGSDGDFQIHISSAMWERASRKNKVAVGILAHEISHLYFSDLRTLVWLKFAVRMVKTVCLLSVGSIITVVGACMLPIGFDLYGGVSLIQDLYKVAATFSAGLLFSIIPVIGFLTSRRQSALITALIEVRADACGGLWTGGTKEFASALRCDEGLKPTSISDLGHSMFSVDISHLSAVERIELLGDHANLATPKLRYAALTAILSFSFPLNPLTPLLENGALDYWFMAAIVIDTHMAAVAMILASSASLPSGLPWRNCMMTAFALACITVLPQVNTYEFGYLLTHWVFGFVVPGGFGKDPLTASVMLGDLGTAVGGFCERILAASGGPNFLSAVSVSAITLKLLSILGKTLSHLKLRTSINNVWAAPAIVAGLAAAVSVDDHWRSLEWTLMSFPSWLEPWVGSLAWLRLSSPPLAGLVTTILEIVLMMLLQQRSRQVHPL